MMNTETQELTTTNILSLFQTSKSQRNSFCHDVIDKLVNEETDPLQIHLQIKAMEEVIDTLTNTDEKKNKNFELAKTYKKYLLDAAEKYGKKFTYQNAEFSIKEVGTVYDFSECGDLELLELQINSKLLIEKIKAKQDFLKTISLSGLVITDESTGDTYKVYPPLKKSTTSVSVSLK